MALNKKQSECPTSLLCDKWLNRYRSYDRVVRGWQGNRTGSIDGKHFFLHIMVIHLCKM